MAYTIADLPHVKIVLGDAPNTCPGGVLQRVDNHLHLAALALAEELEFSGAARRLQISVPELKERITQLESLLSLRLFERDSTHVALTASGQIYVEHIRKSRLI
jgi:hypothetical protein